MKLTKLEAFVLNALSDDIENLEQIYISIAFNFSSELFSKDSNSFYLRPNKEFQYSLPDIIESLIKFYHEKIILIVNNDEVNSTI